MKWQCAERSPLSDSEISDVRRAMEFRFATGALLAVCGFAFTGCAALRHYTPNPAERAILSTYIVASEKAMGTGFLVAARAAGGGEVPVLVTSTHVVTGAEGEPVDVYLRFVTADGNAFVIPVPLSTSQPGETYAVHPSLDVVAFRIDRPSTVPDWAVLPMVEESDIHAKREMRAGEKVVFAGFPEGNGGPSGVFAVLRSGMIASFDQSFLGFPFFAVNAGAYPGDSGAPVYVLPIRGRPKLVGMVVEYLADTGEQPMPLALAVDARTIRTTIDALLGADAGTREDSASLESAQSDAGDASMKRERVASLPRSQKKSRIAPAAGP